MTSPQGVTKVENKETIDDCLLKKMILLGKIAANINTQSRFIQRREMKGLSRVTGEWEAMINELKQVDQELAGKLDGEKRSRLLPAIQVIAEKQKTILNYGYQVLREAMTERSRIAAELAANKQMKQLRKGYVDHWSTAARGSRFNEKG